ncbi:deoxyribonuclease IV [Candidatus Uhrbacteria bacterium]|nr:deoxyribonuclease IV [Candidatus Uhrbacteria bacterium]
MRFGAHVSSAGGLWNAPANAAALGCEVFQMFSRPPQGGKPQPITEETVDRFQAAMKEHGQATAYIHAPYFINLASSEPRIRHGSREVIRQELERGSALGCRAVMFHPGSCKDAGEEQGVRYVIKGLNDILDGYQGSCQLLIEISAGAGMVMGDTIEEIAEFLKGTKRGDEIGVCFDTQHAFASGYDLRTKKGVVETFGLLDKLIGLDRLLMSHCNDSKVKFGAKKDRHEHLGKGHIGLEGFEALVRAKNLRHLDLILETPYTTKDQTEIKQDMAHLKRFRDES